MGEDLARRLITKGELAALLRVTTRTVDRYVAARVVPPPQARMSRQRALWRRADAEAFAESGRWPDEAFKRRR